MCRSQNRRRCRSAQTTPCLILPSFLKTHLFPFFQSSTRDLTYDLSNNTFDDCGSKVTVVSDETVRRKWNTCRANFSQAWRGSEQNLKKSTHSYMENHHSLALYLFTNMMLQPVNQNFESAERASKQKDTFEPFSLYSSLSQAIQILKHNQMTCLKTNYRTETLFQHNISGKQVRFSTFILGYEGWSFAGNVLCFEMYSCFGANITPYSALKQKSQVLIPPYEVFIVTGVQKQTKGCKITYKLRSNINCVYDRENNKLHSITALPVEGIWLIFTIICFVIMSLFLPCVILKFHHKMNSVCRVAPLQHSTSI
uniref:NAD(P)(+)--arginine ADP-ribosyltransferase n=1 Tax=Kryptolebias marmoratus TaxID=37003 RepID=A0A3Q3GIK3_KRYMA